MIMVITLSSDASLEESCSKNSPQLLVYEMGETFGGYWGMLPEVMLKQKPPETKFYTLKTTQPSTEPTEPRQVIPRYVTYLGRSDLSKFDSLAFIQKV